MSLFDGHYIPGGSNADGFDIQSPISNILSSDYTRADGTVFDGSTGQLLATSSDWFILFLNCPWTLKNKIKKIEKKRKKKCC